MSDEAKVIKTIIPEFCPHCKKLFFISYQMMPPTACRPFTPEENENAKADLKKRIEGINFRDKKEKDGIIKWIDNEETFLEASDVDQIVKQILKNESELEK